MDGGLAAAVPLAHFDEPAVFSSGKDRALSFDAVLLLLETVRDDGNALGLVILDIRRFDERALYGTLEGSTHVPVDHLPKAVHMNDEEWVRMFRFHNGNLTRYEILSKVYNLKNELKDRKEPSSKKVLADEYLNKVLDFIGEFTY